MAKRTSRYVDEELLREAEAILGTPGSSRTVKATLEDVVRRACLKSLTTWEIGLTPDDLDTLRRSRFEFVERIAAQPMRRLALKGSLK